MSHIVKVELDWYRLETFIRTGHPRTIGIVLQTPHTRKSELFEGVEIKRITVNGDRVGQR